MFLQRSSRVFSVNAAYTTRRAVGVERGRRLSVQMTLHLATNSINGRYHYAVTYVRWLGWKVEALFVMNKHTLHTRLSTTHARAHAAY